MTTQKIKSTSFLQFLAAGFLLLEVLGFQSSPRLWSQCCYKRIDSVSISSRLNLVGPLPNQRGQLLSNEVYDTIASGQIAVLPNFFAPQDVAPLRKDAQQLWNEGHFSTDALASYGSSGKFDPRKDRAVLRLTQWKNPELGNHALRRDFGQFMGDLRRELAVNLHRPNLIQGLGSNAARFGYGSTEISYTRFGPGAFLKRHVDEHHEELKGVAGWSQPTRRSLTWLIYLNDPTEWTSKDGGELRCFPRRAPVSASTAQIGAATNGDLQLGWLRATPEDPLEWPVYLDAQIDGHHHGHCQMYVVDAKSNNQRRYISKSFQTNPILYVQGAEQLAKQFLLADKPDVASRFHMIEPPKSRLDALLSGDSYVGQGEAPASDEEVNDVTPYGGTLVLFDSVTLPHEVLATKAKDRWACSGWFHEDQQAA